MPSITREKVEYEERVNRLLDSYGKVFFVGVDNVTSQQMHAIRRSLRGKGELLMGKNTLQKKCIKNRSDKNGSEADKAMATVFCNELITGNCGLIFTNEGMETIDAIIKNNRIQAPARVGAISPVEVVIPAGNTGMEPTMTSFFQALNITTKIAKGTVEIVSDVRVLKVGDKVDNSTATLLTKLNIKPFFYGLDLRAVWDNGVVFTAEDLLLTDDIIGATFDSAITNITALSLGAGIPTEASYPHLLVDAFKNLLAASVASDYSFPEFNGAQLRDDIKSGKAAAAAAPAAAAAAAPAAKAAAAKEAPKEEEEDDDIGMGLFF